MSKLLTAIGWILATIGIVFVLFSVIVFFQALRTGVEKDWSAFTGGVLFAGVAGIPGALLLHRNRVARKKAAFDQRLRGFISSLDSFSVSELATKIGRNEMETEGLIATLIAKGQVDLAFHRQSSSYLHRNRIKRGHRVIERCHSCGASVGQELVFDGETPECRYCGVPLMPS